MTAVAFLLLIWAVTLFHQREHKAYVNELRDIAQTASVKDRDWRVIGHEAGVMHLRRAFDIRSRMDILRYALPLVFFAVILLGFGSWGFAFIYLAFIGVKWFLTVTEVHAQGYSLTLMRQTIWAESF